MKRNEMIRIVQIVGQLLLSDMALTALEGDFLERLMERYALDKEARSEVFAGINIGDDPADGVADLSDEARAQLVAVLHEAADADGVIGPVEADVIARVEKAAAAAGS